MAACRVLLVDDEAGFLDPLLKRLRRRGITTTASNSGEEALQRIVTEPPDVVVLDVKMPGMGGLETLREIKRNHPLVEVIMLTGHATVESAIEGMKHGAYDYLMKPCDFDQLMEKLNEATAKKREHEAKILEARATMISLRRGD